MLKRIILISVLIIIYGVLISHKIKSVSVSKIDLNLDNEEIGIIINDKSNFFIIKKNDENTLLLLKNEYKKNIENTMNIFGIDFIDNFVSDIDINIKYSKKYNINNIKLNYLSINKSENITFINLYNYKFCIYNKGSSQNINNCTFIYFNDIDDNLDIVDTNKVVFYNKNISEDFKEILYTKWIDIYSIDDNNYTVLKVKKDNYNIINIPK